MLTPKQTETLHEYGERACAIGRAEGGVGRHRLRREFGISEDQARWLASYLRECDYHLDDDTQEEDESGDEKESARYTYDAARDVYVVKLRKGEESFSGDLIRSLRAAYSEPAGNPTMRDVAHRHGLTRNHFDDIRAAMGWTKRDLPFTEETLQSVDEGALVRDALAMKARRVESEFARQSAEADRADAERWRRMWHSVGEKIRESAARPQSVGYLDLEETDPYVLVLGLQDFHFGAYGCEAETGEKYNRESAIARLYEATEFIVSRLPGRPVEIIVPVAGDMIHIDTAGGTTTKGTPQDVDGTSTEIALVWLKLLRAYIDSLRQVAPVRCIPLHGNHDLIVSTVILSALAEIYRDTEGVIVEAHGRRRHYVEWEGNLLAFSHGDGVKYSALSGVVAAEAAAAWGRTTSRHIFTGHLHHERVLEKPGCKTYIMPSLAGPDRFHEKGGYHSEAGMMGFLVEAGGLGVTRQVFAPIR